MPVYVLVPRTGSIRERPRDELLRSGVDFGTVGKAGVPTAPALRGEVHEVPDRSEQVNATLLNVGGQPRVRCVKVAQGTLGVAGENGNSRVLMAFAVFAAQIIFETVIAGVKEAQFVPAPRSSMGAQSREIGGGHSREVKILSEVMGDTIRAVEPGSAHWASFGLLLSEHEVIDDERAIGPGEEFAEAYGARRRITGVEVARTLFKLIVLNSSTLRKIAAQLSHMFALA